MTPRSFLRTPDPGDQVRASPELPGAVAPDERSGTVLLPMSDGLTMLRLR